MTLKHASHVATPGTLALLCLALLAAAGCSGKGTNGACVDGAVCGGDPTGTWNVDGACQFAADAIVQALGPGELVRNPQPPVLTASPVAQTTDGAWCSRLFYGALDTDPMIPNSKIREVDLPHGAPPLAAPAGSMTFNKSPNTYSVKLSFAGADSTHFGPLCLQVGGVTPSCTDLALNLTQFYVTKAGMDAQGNVAPPTFTGIACGAASDGGCDCNYTYQVTLTDSGTWNNLGSAISEASDPGAYQYNGQPVAASQQPGKALDASFCVQNGTTLTLSGYNGTALSNAPGLRVLSLVKQ
jgi:hypothetical protein